MEEDEILTPGSEGVNAGGDWDPPTCPFLFLGDDDAAEYDLQLIKKSGAKIKQFFSQFKKK